MKLTLEEFTCIAQCLEGFFCELYSGIFAMYLQCHASKNDTDRTKNIIFYALCILYILSVAIIVLDVVGAVTHAIQVEYYMSTGSSIIFGCCDFISQSILLYRCWIVWGRNHICVVIIPSILAFTFLATWLAATGAIHISPGQIVILNWEDKMVLTGLAISMAVNALVVGLIVLKIFKVFQQVEGEQNWGATGRRKLRSMIFILVESGMALFSVQLARLVVTILQTMGDATYNPFLIITGIHQMLNGITPTIILVRVSMGLSFHDESSMVEATASLCFAPDNSDSITETGSISIGHQESRDEDIGIQQTNSIQMADG